MFQGKTKQGVSMRSTLGMKSGVHNHTWILVADRSHVRLFERTRDESGPLLQLKEDYANPDGRKKGRDLVSDHPGRSFDSHDMSTHGQSGGARHSYGNSFLPEDRITQDLVKYAVHLVGNALVTNGSHLFVLAEPSLMGLLRPALQREIPKIEMTFRAKDFAWLDISELKQRLEKLIR